MPEQNPAVHPRYLLNPAGGLNHWQLDPAVTFLNHGAFGACPLPVLAAQHEWRLQMERQPLQFLVRELEPALDLARTELARFLGAQADDVVFVANATAGVNAVLRSLEFSADDELLITSHAYNACRNVVEFVAGRARARVVTAQIPFPFASEQELIEPILKAATPKTRLALLDHVTSPTGVIFPIKKLVQELQSRGI